MKIVYSELAYKKIMYFVNKANFEVSGFGDVTFDRGTQVFTVHDAYLIEQESGAVHTDIDGQKLAKLMYERRSVVGACRLWWHSHVDMNVFWSSTDKETIEELGKNGWIIATVFNKSGDKRSAVCYSYKSDLVDSFVLVDEVATLIDDNVTSDLARELDKEFEARVTFIEAQDNNRVFMDSRWDSVEYARRYKNLLGIDGRSEASLDNEHLFY